METAYNFDRGLHRPSRIVPSVEAASHRPVETAPASASIFADGADGRDRAVPAMPVQTFRDLALDCPFSTRDLAAALWVDGPAAAVERGSASAVRPPALRQRRRTRYVFRFLAISVGDARGA